jgi:RNA polymerase sigma-70 factor, ECF subfamily
MPMFSRDPFANPERLIRRVYAYVAYRIGEGPDAEDVTSETFERALRYRDSYDRKKGEPAAWLIGIARRCLANPSSVAIPVAEPAADLAATDDLEEATVRRVTLGAALAKLSERDRELLALRYGADLTAGQIGELLELQPNAVEVALHRARERLAASLGGPNEGESEGPGAEAVRV